MHVYLPEKYRPPFLHGVFLFSKVGVLIVNFDGFFILAYSSHILKARPLEGFCCHHTSMSSTLYLKGCQICPTFSLEKGIMERALPCAFGLPPSLIMPPKCSNWVYFGVRLCESKFGFFCTMKCFHAKFLELPSYSNHKNHFDIGSK